MGDRLVVALTVDEAVNKGPGLPINAWELRATVLRALRCVDDVVPSRTSWDAIRSVRPDVFVKGDDYRGALPMENVEACREVGAVIHFTSTPKMSSREIAKRLKETA